MAAGAASLICRAENLYGYSAFIVSGYIVEYSAGERGYQRPYLTTEETVGILSRSNDYTANVPFIGPLVRAIPDTHIIHVVSVGSTPEQARERHTKTIALLQIVHLEKLKSFRKLQASHAEVVADQIVLLEKRGARENMSSVIVEKKRLLTELQSVSKKDINVPYTVLHEEPIGLLFPTASKLIQFSLTVAFLAAGLVFFILNRIEDRE